MKRLVRSENKKPVMNAEQMRGYKLAKPLIKKYAKAMKVLG
jgi:hypothetical protein